jgi:hypothetical protein
MSVLISRVGPEAAIVGSSFCGPLNWQYWFLSIEGDAYPGRGGHEALENSTRFPTLPHHRPNEYGALRCEIAKLHAAAREHGDSVLVFWVIRFGAKLDRLTRYAQASLKASGRAALVRIRQAHDSERELPHAISAS